tara:strand:- start:50384 stop:51565 length:1182 start_codon:yes stop_codon:yes gene_type:complete
MKEIDVLVIGAGAAGLMCAIEAGKRGRSVLVLDHANKVGKKILMSGGGRCNFTNLEVSHKHFISHNPHFCKSALGRFTPDDFIALVEKHDIPYHEKTLGQLFCDKKSKDIVDMLLQECDDAGVNIKLNVSVDNIKQEQDNSFALKTTLGELQCQSLVIATGGLSIPTMGASPFGYKVAEQFGIAIRPTRAALVPFTLQPHDKEKSEALSGIAVDCTAECNNTQFNEAMLFTHRGLSGPAMLQISSYWNAGDAITIKMLPELDLLDQLVKAKKQNPNTLLKTPLTQHFSKRMINIWLGEKLENQPLQSCSNKQLEAIAATFQHWQPKPNGTEGYRTAEVTLGGVDCNAVSSKTFEANEVPNLYFIGEVLDVTGWLGGYNFQWAWASGFVAGNVV